MERQEAASDVKERLTLATQAAKSGDFENALLHLKAIIDRHADSEIAWGMLAAIYAQIGMNDRALDGYQRVLSINPANTLARFQLGLTLLMNNRPQEALDTWKPCLTPDDFMAHFHSALALLQLGRVAEALPMLETAEKRAPRDHLLQPEIKKLLAKARS